MKKTALGAGDVVIIRTGNAGKACVIPDGLGPLNCADLIIVRPSQKLDSHFAAIYINSAATRSHVQREMVGIAQGHFNIGSMRSTPITLPPLSEQREIARRVVALFGLANLAEMRHQTAMTRTERVTDGVLSRAFSGGL
jgi:type I restriction enzyme S subunit